jgi:hypothetical protein
LKNAVSELFKTKFIESSGEVAPELFPELDRIARYHRSDLSPTQGRTFSNDDLDVITCKAADELAKRSVGVPLTQAWGQVVEDFRSSHMWGINPQEKMFSLPRPDANFREFASYFIVLVNSMIFVKVALIYFGTQSVTDPESNATLWTIVAMAASFTLPFVFVWRKRKK